MGKKTVIEKLNALLRREQFQTNGHFVTTGGVPDGAAGT
jgi:hypothetical protein